MSPEHYLEEIMRIRADSLYGKKAHYNAAERKMKNHVRLRSASFIFSLLTVSSLFSNVIDELPAGLFWVPLTAALLAFLLSSLQVLFKWDDHSRAHSRIATRYLCISKDASRSLALARDNLLNDDEVISRIDGLAEAYADVTRDAEYMPYSKKDIEEARKSIESGREQYTDDELKA